jgi:adenylosuccinate lyase
MDTAQVLIIRDAVEMIEERINILMNALEELIP